MTTTIQSNTILRIARRLVLPVAAVAVAVSSISAAMFTPEKAVAKPIVTVVLPKVFAPVARPAASGELMHDAAVALPPQHIANVRIVMMEVTAYCPCPKCCGPNAAGITASGKDVRYNAGRFVAADSSLPFGTRLMIPGYDAKPVEVIDRGGAIKGNKIDVFFPTHQQALQWGRRHIAVTVID
jgi:3D (Asp-Asp-Asp) domain-containing protein